MKGLRRAFFRVLLIFLVVLTSYVAFGTQCFPSSALAAEEEVSSAQRNLVKESPTPKLNNESTITIVYYFHRTARCRTCRALEGTAKEAINEAFADSLSNGALLVKSINIDELSNRHFIEQYQIYGPSLVLSRMEGNKELNWKNLDQIWQLIRTPIEYKAYVVEELKSFTKETT